MSVTAMQQNCTINQNAYVGLLISRIHFARVLYIRSAVERPVLGTSPLPVLVWLLTEQEYCALWYSASQTLQM
jgi:hypothetical protein